MALYVVLCLEIQWSLTNYSIITKKLISRQFSSVRISHDVLHFVCSLHIHFSWILRRPNLCVLRVHRLYSHNKLLVTDSFCSDPDVHLVNFILYLNLMLYSVCLKKPHLIFMQKLESYVWFKSSNLVFGECLILDIFVCVLLLIFAE